MAYKKVSGIYTIQSGIKSNFFYIGSSRNISARRSSHFRQLETNTHINIKLTNHVRKYGLSDLEFFIIELCDEGSLLQREQFYIDILEPKFNILKIAGSPLGRKFTEKQRGNFVSRLGQKTSQLTKDRIGLANKGRKPSELAIKNSIESRKINGSTDEYKKSSSVRYAERKIKNNIDGIVVDPRFPNGYSSIFMGVYYEQKKRTNNHWAVRIRITNKYAKRIGRFDSEIKAAMEYNKYIIENNIENKALNIIP